MAELSFYANDISSSGFNIENVISYELSRDVDAACDGLRLSFVCDKTIGELSSIKAYKGKRLVFNGYVDTQRETIDDNGRTCFLYARSSACVLLDNEAAPRSYLCPSSSALFINNARDFGFVNKLPGCHLALNYVVGKGTSCYGAINNFISMVTGKSVMINAENELVIPDGGECFNIDNYRIISEKRAINRGSLISRADYKIEGDHGYSHHIKSRYLEENGVFTSKKINLSSLPVWQREYAAKNIIKDSCRSYQRLDLLLEGCAAAELYSAVKGHTSFGSLNDYYITGICIILDSKGERTRLSLSKNIDLEEITYVAE